jgi:hypothetical protein
MAKRSYKKMVDKLAQAVDVPAEEIRTLSEVQVATIWQAFEDSRQNRISKEEAVDLLTENGFFDLPTPRQELDRGVLQQATEYVRDAVDYHNAQCLQRGEFDKLINVAKEDDEPYPPARGN